MKGVTRHYENITVWERFLLVLDSSFRKDNEEITKLFSTCPKRAYLARDMEFFGYFNICRELCMIVNLFWWEAYHRYTLAVFTEDAFGEITEAFGTLIAVQSGFRRFCKKIGVEPDKMLTQAEPLAKAFRLEMDFQCEFILPNQEHEKFIYDSLIKFWRSRVQLETSCLNSSQRQFTEEDLD